MLAIAFCIAERQNADRKLEDVELGDAGAGVAKRSRGGRVDGEGRDLGDGILAGGRDP